MPKAQTEYSKLTHSPRVAKVDLVNPHEDHSYPARGRFSFPSGRSVSAVQTGDNDVRNSHADSTRDEDGLATKLINVENGGNSGKHKKNTTNSTSQERCCVASETQVLEDEGGIVQDGVDTGPCSQSVSK